MKTAISIPDIVFQAAERLSRRLGVSRSQLYGQAVAEYLKEHGSAGITEALNRVYGENPQVGTMDTGLLELQKRSLPSEDW